MVKTCFKKESCEKYKSTLPNLIDRPALPILPHLTTLPSTALKQKYLVTSVICMNNDTNKSAICHHKLAKWELVNILEELKVETEKNYGHWWCTKQYERKKRQKKVNTQFRYYVHVIIPARAQMCWTFIISYEPLPELEIKIIKGVNK